MSETPLNPEFGHPEPQSEADIALEGIYQAVEGHDATAAVAGLTQLREVVLKDYFEEEGHSNPNKDRLDRLRRQVDQMDAVIAGYNGLIGAGDSQQVLEEAAELYGIYRESLE